MEKSPTEMALAALEEAARLIATNKAPGPPFVALGQLFPEVASAVGGWRSDGQFVVRLEGADHGPILVAMNHDRLFDALQKVRRTQWR